jgi:hypothetical protein
MMNSDIIFLIIHHFLFFNKITNFKNYYKVFDLFDPIDYVTVCFKSLTSQLNEHLLVQLVRKSTQLNDNTNFLKLILLT